MHQLIVVDSGFLVRHTLQLLQGDDFSFNFARVSDDIPRHIQPLATVVWRSSFGFGFRRNRLFGCLFFLLCSAFCLFADGILGFGFYVVLLLCRNGRFFDVFLLGHLLLSAILWRRCGLDVFTGLFRLNVLL